MTDRLLDVSDSEALLAEVARLRAEIHTLEQRVAMLDRLAHSDSLIDVPNRRMDVALSDEEIARRVAAYEAPPREFDSGVLGKYAKLVGSASEGAITR